MRVSFPYYLSTLVWVHVTKDGDSIPEVLTNDGPDAQIIPWELLPAHDRGVIELTAQEIQAEQARLAAEERQREGINGEGEGAA